jgi:dolichol-phosphate mannosyltransferase
VTVPPEGPRAPDNDVDEIAVIVPIYLGGKTVVELCCRLVATLESITDRFSILLIDDGSPDESWSLIVKLGLQDRRIRGIRLSRNFGQHYALTAGIDQARAQWYVVMDGDLQDAPEDIPLLYQKAKEGFQVVVGVREKEGHGFIKRYSSRLFYASFNLLSGLNLDWSIGNFRVFSERAACGLRGMREQLRFLPASFSFMGFECARVALPHYSRVAGKSAYTLSKLARLAVHTILAHSQMPLRIAAGIGLCVAVLSILAGIAIAIRAYFWAVPVSGWASLIVSIFIVGGIQIFITGLVGIYVGKAFEEAKKRPLYFVSETSNLQDPHPG